MRRRRAGGAVVVLLALVSGSMSAVVSTDLETWTPLPNELYGGAGGILSLVAAVDGLIVVVGTAGELDRYSTINREALRRS